MADVEQTDREQARDHPTCTSTSRPLLSHDALLLSPDSDPAALRAQLDEVRATGIAYEVEEAVLGECEVAARSAIDSAAPSARSGWWCRVVSGRSSSLSSPPRLLQASCKTAGDPQESGGH
jgi:hypothetical protein